jgi:hypothetical protein
MADQGPEQKADEGPEDAALPPDSARPRRAPPTIDLDASEVTSETHGAETDPAAQAAAETPEPAAAEHASEQSAPEKPQRPISPWVIAPVSGAVAAALVIGIGWMLGWPPVQSAATPQVTTAAVDALTARVAGLEAKLAKPATDPAVTTQLAALEKSQAALRDQLAATRTQSDKIAAQVSSIKSSPDGATAPIVDLSAITARLDALEQSSRSEASAIEQSKAQATADDAPLRRVVVATLLDLSVRQGEAFAATLATAKTVAPDAASLQPLEGFASTGVPTAASLSRELLTLVPKLSPPPAENTAPAGASLVDRLKSSAVNLVHLERVDTSGADRNAIVARVTAAAQRNDVNEARRELKTLPAADRAPAQSWIDKADARDAALAASRQFAADAMTALAKPAQ